MHLVDLDTLLALRAHGAEALEAAAALGHLLDADDIGALLGALQGRHEAGDASTDHDDVAIFRGRNLVSGDLAILEAHWAARARAGGLLHGHPAGLAREAIGALGRGTLFGSHRHARTAQGSHRARGDAHGAGAAQEIAPGYASLLHGSSFSPRTPLTGSPDTSDPSFPSLPHGPYTVKLAVQCAS